jgi:pyruvate,water dikinase
MSTYCINGKEVVEGDYCFLGGKALAFAKLREYCLPIPEWFVVKNQVLYDSFTPGQLKILESGNIKRIREELGQLVFSNEFHMEISENLGKISGEYFAVRSSALSEDSGKTSFAGQFDSYLWIKKEQV